MVYRMPLWLPEKINWLVLVISKREKGAFKERTKDCTNSIALFSLPINRLDLAQET
jgi:hypothetical protein